MQPVRRRLANHAGHAYTVLRLGLGLMVLFAGVHKLFRPTIWGSYTAPWAADALTALGLTVDGFMRANGIVEMALGLIVLADRYTAIAAGLVALSLLAITVNLASIGTSAASVLIRDIGLLALAVGVTLMAAERRSETAA